ncbi:hypothetical protein [Aneurinibacillus tyrosinisolvens]|uniref:hypothetical protein n=1 Tax=Aneurinibacillus tyrosinisolvens TaxID=1443435 RepID=UPI00063EE6C9|nr:hypothetical protein [Aneurinibacillus tyrosinisolvens]
MKFTNCSACGKLCIETLKKLCQACFAQREENYQTVHQYLLKNKGATTIQASEGTGISLKSIHTFIREKRFIATDFPNIGYPCEACGTNVQEGKFCGSCAMRLQKEIYVLNLSRDRQAAVEETSTYRTKRWK